MRLCAFAGKIFLAAFVFQPSPAQGPQLDYSKFLHTSQRHSSLACNSCHERTDNSATPRFPGHKACTDCHRGQFTTPAVPMCVICHVNVSGNNPPLKDFPSSFNERFNVRFDHAQHMNGSARPPRGCAGCHGTPVNRRRRTIDSGESRGAQQLLRLPHTDQQIKFRTRDRLVRSLSRTESVSTDKHQRALLSLRVQSCRSRCARTTRLRRLSQANGGCATNSASEFTGAG